MRLRDGLGRAENSAHYSKLIGNCKLMEYNFYIGGVIESKVSNLLQLPLILSLCARLW
jgi:hypothetical protein